MTKSPRRADEPYTKLATPRAQTNAKKPEPAKSNASPSLAFAQLYRYATPFDKLCLAVGVLCAAVNGALFPCMALVFGKAIQSFQRADEGVDRSAINSAALDYLYIAIGLFVTDYAAHVLFSFTAERQMKALRLAVLRHLLYMDISWYDTNNAMQLSSRLTGDTVKIKNGMGSKLGDAVKFTGQFVTGYIIGLYKGWDMTLVMSCVVPIMSISLSWLLKMLRTRAEFSQKMYAQAGAVAEETLSSIRTVASLNGEKRAIEKFSAKAVLAETKNIQMIRSSSSIVGLYFGSFWMMYATGLWYGGSRVAHNKYTPAEVFQSFFAVLLGTSSLAQITPNLTAVAQARGAAAAIYKILDTPAEINASTYEGAIPDFCAGHIQAIDVHFAYPSRPDAPVLNGCNVTIESGQTVAFVGASGGGKSTLIALLERFYNPQSGQILLDGRDISTLNLKWLRSQIGMVSQEPVLFARTIYENIAAGGDNISREQAIEAAKMANAHNFIMSLPQQYDTLVGEKGVSLSGGQKQRVAIARAVVRNPKILVLDEATSALDNESERVVQDALNELMDKTEMTTLVIAHRLSTIRRADKIVVLSGGRVVEEGKHEELLSIPDGVYNNLYTIQEEKMKVEAEVDASELEAVAEDTVIARSPSQHSTNTAKDFGVTSAVQDTFKLKKFRLVDVIRLSYPERKFYCVGLVSAAICGFGLPTSALLISEMVTRMTHEYGKFKAFGDRTYLDDLSDDVTLYGACYVAGAAVMCTFSGTQAYCFRYMAEKLTSRLRIVHFTALCRQNIAFFDEKKHATGALTAELATSATKVAMLSGDSQGRVVQAAFTLTAALVVSFVAGSWLLTLVMLIVIPLLILGQVFRMNNAKAANSVSDELAEVGAHASEAFGNIRTVVALGSEERLVSEFDDILDVPLTQGRKEAQVNGLALGFGSFIILAAYSLAFWYGGKLVARRDITFIELIRTLMAVLMSAQGVGNAASFLAESDRALQGGATISAVRDRPLPIDSFDEGGLRPDTVQGKIEFKNITFRYPTRPGVTVLRHYNLTIEPGQTVAFCGPSGGGKSTCISMIERFYDPVEGQVLLDGRNLKDLNVQWLRSQIGLVGQEPTLFIGTIAENIAYGLDFKPSHEEIVTAAKMVNAHDFITQFPDGYETQVGMKGEQLSGGQKQRIAIARAILKNPNILLLDEATSALDSESEKIVQEALDKVVALKRRTTIIIAHRLSTIRKADKICVVGGGKIAEQGTHAELLALGGIYKKLVESSV